MSLLRVASGWVVVSYLTAGMPLPAASNVPPPSPDLQSVKSVYILPMRSGFDQYLANELTSGNVLRIVTDPRRADAVLTDHLGDSFQKRMDDFFPPPPKPTPESDAKDKSEAPSSDQVEDSRPISTGFKGTGNVFLVGREGRTVLWSDFRNPRSHQPKDMKHTADSVASDLKHALQPPDSGLK